MANAQLQGTYTSIDDDVKKYLKKVFNAYCGNKNVEGYTRLKNICDNNKISYEQLKRIKNFFDTFDGRIGDTSYMLNGGSRMKNWVDGTLNTVRKGLEGKKKSMKDVGMNNQYIDNHEKNGVKINPHDSDTNKILRQEGIYGIEGVNTLIKIIDKNRKLWHNTEHL